MHSGHLSPWFRSAMAGLAAALLWSYVVATTPTTNGGGDCAYAACQD